MSEFAEKKSLKAQIAAAKKAGKSVQTVGRLQYKLNQLMKNPQKGKPVKRKTPSAKQPNNPFKAIASAAPAAKIKGSPIKKKIVANSGSKTKKITPNSGSKVTTKKVAKKVGYSSSYTPTNEVVISNLKSAAKKQADQKKIQAENNKKIAAHQAKLAKQKADKKEAKRQNDAIDAMASKSDKAMRASKKTAARLAGQKQNEKNWNATRKLSTDEKVKQRQKDYRNNKTSPY